jgi:DNA-binding winged helix-turn-helix (wHTH) protein
MMPTPTSSGAFPMFAAIHRISQRVSSFVAARVRCRAELGDSGEKQELIRTIARKGLRFVGEVRTRSRTVRLFLAHLFLSRRKDHSQ